MSGRTGRKTFASEASALGFQHRMDDLVALEINHKFTVVPLADRGLPDRTFHGIRLAPRGAYRGLCHACARHALLTSVCLISHRHAQIRSEERRVGKEGRSRWWPH